MAGGLGYGERRRRLSVRAKNEEGEGKMARGEGGVSTASSTSPGAGLGGRRRRHGEAGGGRGAPACVGHAPILLAKEEDDREGARWAGPATWAARWLPLLSNVSVFYFLAIVSAILKMPEHFQKS